MSVLAQPNHPARLAWLFTATALVCGIVATAAFALVWMVRDQLHDDTPAGQFIVPADLDVGDGLTVVVPMKDREQFEDVAGFTPFVPEKVPNTTDTTPKYAIVPASEDGTPMLGRVAFSAKPDAAVDGITGPIVVLVQSENHGNAEADGQLKRVVDGEARAITALVACGDLLVDVQLYFGPRAEDGEPMVTQYMIELARQFVDTVIAQCAD